MTIKSDFLSIIIVNYNGEKYLSKCFESIQFACDNLDYEVIVVDNNSEDNSVSFIKSMFSWVKVIESKQNLGFSKGNNLGVNHSVGDKILLLNNDTILLDKLTPIINCLNKAQVGLLGARMVNSKVEYRKSAGIFPSPLRLLKLSKMYCSKHGFSDGSFEKESDLLRVDWVEGSFMLTTRRVWSAVNGMDEDYFLYAEDIDLCKRVTLSGHKVFYFSGCRYIHFGGYNSARESLLKKGLERYNNKYHKNLYRQVCRLCLILNFGFKGAKKFFKNFTA